ncbi:MAG: hypothetical protein AAF639_12055 [Chloroflexota bacterium]
MMQNAHTMRNLGYVLVFVLMLLLGNPMTAKTATQATTHPVIACEQDVIVKFGDTMAGIAKQYLGDAAAYPQIIFATHVNIASDSSYTYIPDANYVQVGAKLCIPTNEVGTEQPADDQGSMTAPQADETVVDAADDVDDAVEESADTTEASSDGANATIPAAPVSETPDDANATIPSAPNEQDNGTIPSSPESNASADETSSADEPIDEDAADQDAADEDAADEEGTDTADGDTDTDVTDEDDADEDAESDTADEDSTDGEVAGDEADDNDAVAEQTEAGETEGRTETEDEAAQAEGEDDMTEGEGAASPIETIANLEDLLSSILPVYGGINDQPAVRWIIQADGYDATVNLHLVPGNEFSEESSDGFDDGIAQLMLSIGPFAEEWENLSSDQVAQVILDISEWDVIVSPDQSEGQSPTSTLGDTLTVAEQVAEFLIFAGGLELYLDLADTVEIIEIRDIEGTLQERLEDALENKGTNVGGWPN